MHLLLHTVTTFSPLPPSFMHGRSDAPSTARHPRQQSIDFPGPPFILINSLHSHRDRKIHMVFAAAPMKIARPRRRGGYICVARAVLVIGFVVFCSFMAAPAAADDNSGSSSTNTAPAVLIRVDQSGNGDYTKIQDAIDAVPSNNSEVYFIWVKPGTYREKIVVPAEKPLITLSGTQASTTIITWGDGGEIFESPTLSVLAPDFVGRFLTIQNTYGRSGKAVAVRVSGDRAAFYNCRILSYQDTLLDDAGRHYYSNCYIEGATDFICGSAASLFEKCHLHSLSEGNGAITAQQRESASENTGFTFLGCKITGVGKPCLGRPWGPYSRVVFALSFMSSAVRPEGWDDWGDSTRQSTVYYGEYKCYGPGANRNERVKWSRNLSSDEAASFLTKDMIGGGAWLRPAPTRFKRGSTVITTINTD